MIPSLIAVLPDQARAEERLLALARRGGLVASRCVLTLAEVQRELIAAAVGAGQSDPVASPQAMRLLLREVARTATPAGSPFASLRDEPGYARALEGLMAALAEGMCEPQDLIARADALPLEVRERALPLLRTVFAARQALSRARLADPHGALRAAVEALERGLPLPRALRPKEALVFEAILDWTPLRQRLVPALAAQLPEGARVRVRLPWAAGRPELTAALEPALRAFESLGASAKAAAARIDVELFDPGEAGPLAPFLGRLFARGAQDLEAADAARASPVTLRSCSSPQHQAREAARACADAAARGVPLSEIAVAARSLGGGVAEELGAALDRAGLPWRERRGKPALPSPPAQLALSLYALLERNFPREGLLALLTSPLLQRDGFSGVRARRAAKRLREARVRDDAPDAGPHQEGGIALRLSQQAARLRGDQSWGQERDAAEVDQAAELVAQLLADVRHLPQRATLEGHGRALCALLDRWRMGDAIARAAPRGEQGSAATLAAASARDLAALDSVQNCCTELAQAAAALGRASASHDRAAFAELLREALAEASLSAAGARGAAVQLVELRELFGRSFRALVMVGLLDGELPARAQPDPLLSDDDKRALNRALGRPVLRTPPSEDPSEGPALLPARLLEEPLLFHLGACAARESLLLLWPRADGQGREALRSPFADEAIRALGLTAKEQAALAVPLSPVPPLAGCRSPAELLARAALEGLAEPSWRASQPIPDDQARALLWGVVRSPLLPRLPGLLRAASAERERLRTFALEAQPGRFSGGIAGAALQAALPALRFDEQDPLSASALEKHGTCGFKHFAGRLLGVPERDDPADELQNRERGTLLHNCLQRFFARMQSEGRLPLRGGAWRDAELRTLAEEADAAIDRYATEQLAGHAALYRVRRREIHRRLARLIEAEAAAGGLPRDLEREFGGAAPGALPPLKLVSPDGAETIWVKGRIDRIDEVAAGRQLVLDYKAGGIEGARRKLRTDTLLAPEFQLALYAAAVAQARPGVEVDAALVSVNGAARTRTLRETARKAGLDPAALLALDPAERARLRQKVPPPLNLADRVWERVHAMRAGRFPIAPLSCENCDLGPVCRIVALPVEDDE